jgi:hypothetical protein
MIVARLLTNLARLCVLLILPLTMACEPTTPPTESVPDVVVAPSTPTPGVVVAPPAPTPGVVIVPSAPTPGSVVVTLPTDPIVVPALGVLEEYKTSMRDVLTLNNVAFLDADETCNCIVVGITDQSAAASVENFAKNVGVPSTSLKTVLTRPLVAFPSLIEGIRPIKGGLRIENEDNMFCTMTGTVFHKGQNAKGLPTNSHCTRAQGAYDGIEFFQAGGALFSSDFVAREVIDPLMKGSLPGCPTGRLCRHSDAAFAQFDTSTVGIVGKIARPSSLCTPGPCTASMDNSEDQLLILEDRTKHPSEGLAYWKV